MAFLPPIVWKKDGDEITQLKNYVMQLEEQIRFVLGNLGAENMAEGGVSEDDLTNQLRQIIVETKTTAQKNRAAIQNTGKEIRLLVSQELLDKILTGEEEVDAIRTASLLLSGDGLYVDTTGEVIIQSGAAFKVVSGAEFIVYSQNLDVDENGLYVKSGTLRGEHYTSDGKSILSEDDIIVSTGTPTEKNNRIWVKPVSSVSVKHSRAISSRVNVIGYSGTLTTSGAASGSGGTCNYLLKLPYHAGTSSGNGIDITATVTGAGGSVVFTGHIAPGSYSGAGYVGDGTLEMRASSPVWFGTDSSVSLSISGGGSGSGNSSYKINTGEIALIGNSAGSSGSGWKDCEVRVYQG